MTRSSMKKLAGAGIAALILAGASIPASANYLGYGNGDPGNWDFWTEQNGGRTPSAPAHIRAAHHVPATHHHSSTPAKLHEAKPY